MTAPAPRAYSYVRFSTPEQSKGDSLRRQTELAVAYAARHKLTLDADLRMHDLGVSAYRGKNLDGTSKLGAFLQAIRQGDVAPGSVLLVESLDRISRKEARKAVRVLEEIVEAGVDVVTLGDGEKRYTKDSLDGFDFIMAVLILMRANEESRTKGKRVAQAWAAKRARQAANGETLTRLTPGWIRVTADGRRELIPERAAIVRRIFELFVGGTGQNGIARTFNDEGLETFGRGNSKALHWRPTYVRKILSSQAVIGTMTPTIDDGRTRTAQAPVEGYFPAVIDRELWERAQALVDTNRLRRPGPSSLKTQNVLAGLARCPHCGGTMTRVYKGTGKKGGYPTLVCVAAKLGATDENGKPVCGYHSVRLDLIETALQRAARNPIPEADADLRTELRNAEGALEGVDHAIEKILAAIEASGGSKALITRLKAHEAQREQVAADLAALERQAAESETKTLKRKRDRYRAAMTAKPFDILAANLALREMVSRVTVDYDRQELVMHWRHDGESCIVYDTPDMEAARTAAHRESLAAFMRRENVRRRKARG